MSSVTKMQLFEKIRSLPKKSGIHFLTISQIICNDVTNKFASERNPRRNYDLYGHGIYWFDVPAAILGKWRREGLVHLAGQCFRQSLYELSDLLKDFKIREYQRYVNNYNFYKNNIGIIEIVFEEQKVSQDERDFWISHFYRPVAKQHFLDKKRREKEARQNFDIGDYISFETRNKAAWSHSLHGEIVKLNPMRAVIKVDIPMSSKTQLWMCPYSRLELVYTERLVA